MIVVDLGCMEHWHAESIGPLVRTFAPEILYGFDPHPQLTEGVTALNSTVVVCRRLAAWTYDGRLPLHVETSSTRIVTESDDECECFNLALFLRTLPEGAVLKLDCEGAEYPLLQDLYFHGEDERLALVLVEWHEDSPWKVELPELRCRVAEWTG